MIQGFTSNALVIYPLADDYHGRGSQYFLHMNAAATNLQKYLKLNNITYDCFITDDVAKEVVVTPDRWISTLNQGDLFFVKNNCEGMDKPFGTVITNDDVIKTTLTKYPTERGLSVERRFEQVLKRDAMARRELVKLYKMVVLFKQPKSPTIRYTVKPGSGLMYIEIDNSTFLVKCYMSDTEVGATELLEVKNGFMPMYEWEVE